MYTVFPAPSFPTITRTLESSAGVDSAPNAGSPPKSTKSPSMSSMSAREPSGLPNGPTGSAARRPPFIASPGPLGGPSDLDPTLLADDRRCPSTSRRPVEAADRHIGSRLVRKVTSLQFGPKRGNGPGGDRGSTGPELPDDDRRTPSAPSA